MPRSQTVPLRIFDNIDEARRTVLRRRRLLALDEVPQSVRASIKRVFGAELTPSQAVARILDDIAERGDAALVDWTARIDGVALAELEVPPTAWEAAYRALPADLAAALSLAADRIRAFHARQPLTSWTTEDLGGTEQSQVARQGCNVYVSQRGAPGLRLLLE